MEKDIENAKESISHANSHIDKLQRDVNKLMAKVKEIEVCALELCGCCIVQCIVIQADHARASALLDAERATLTEFDTKLLSLEDSMRGFKDGVSDAELAVKKIDHEVAQLEKEKLAQAGLVERLEKGYEWIREECG